MLKKWIVFVFIFFLLSEPIDVSALQLPNGLQVKLDTPTLKQEEESIKEEAGNLTVLEKQISFFEEQIRTNWNLKRINRFNLITQEIENIATPILSTQWNTQKMPVDPNISQWGSALKTIQNQMAQIQNDSSLLTQATQKLKEWMKKNQTAISYNDFLCQVGGVTYQKNLIEIQLNVQNQKLTPNILNLSQIISLSDQNYKNYKILNKNKSLTFLPKETKTLKIFFSIPHGDQNFVLNVLHQKGKKIIMSPIPLGF